MKLLKGWRKQLAARLHWLAFSLDRPAPPTRDDLIPFLDDAFKGPTLEEQRVALEYLAETMVIDGNEGATIFDELMRVIQNWAATRRCRIKDAVLASPDVIAACLVTFEPGERARLQQRVLSELPVQVDMRLARRAGSA